ncbi:TIGR01459 family HAD-type hydrolase [Pseudooceanicola sp. C21-150M6]|uniref:TIGR01459 family HAD-type hydrolase n=1 Tax=Pseudooceanicola sp. C21-150M6 TaxID=3434355 RepID=UPI003D7F4D88
MTRIVRSLAEISDAYDALFVDLWGCVHNGVTAYPAACEALIAYRQRGGIVILVTNSPRPRASVERQLDGFHVPREAWDSIATSGDSARTAAFTGAVGTKVHFIGSPEEKDSFLTAPKILENPAELEIVPLDEAEGIVCTGPVDPFADPDTWRPDLLLAKTRGLKLLCANPDIVVDRGESREWCAGAVAKLYTEMGGQSLYFGKPHPPIYDLARRRLHAIDHKVEAGRILAIGDGIATDVRGAMGEDIDSLFITGGLAASETKTGQDPDAAALNAYLAVENSNPTYAIGFLR